MRSSRLVFGLIATIVSLSNNVRADDYFTPTLRVSLGTYDGTNTPALRRDYLLSYQQEPSPNKYTQWLWKDPINLFTRVGFWGGDQWRTFAVEAGATGALLPADAPFRDFSDDIRNKPLTSTLKPIDFVFGNYPLALLGGGMFAAGLGIQNQKLADSGFLSLESAGYATLIDVGIKGLTERERPRASNDPYEFLGPTGTTRGSSSFVSGDTIAAFAFASSVSEVWQTPWVTWPAYLLASAVAVERTQVDAHWLSDVVGAAFLGHAIGKTIVRMHYHDDIEARLTPYIAPHTVGLQLAFNF